jgi:hypothetical protein
MAVGVKCDCAREFRVGRKEEAIEVASTSGEIGVKGRETGRLEIVDMMSLVSRDFSVSDKEIVKYLLTF